MKKKDQTPLPLKIVRWVYPKLERVAPSLAHRYFIKLFFSPLRYKPTDKERKAETFATKFIVSVADKRIQGYQWGADEKQPYVLVVHGWAGRATQFRRFIKPLNAAGYRVIGFDGPAHGNSEGKKTTILEFEKTLQKFYEKFGEPAAIIAHSFGGGVVLFSAMNGLNVRKLINIGSPTIGDEIINTFLKAINASAATGEFFKSFMIKTYGKTFDEFTALHFVKHLPQPVALLLVHDTSDREVSINHPEALVNAYPQARLIRTEGLGHTRILKDNVVIEQCIAFIRN